MLIIIKYKREKNKLIAFAKASYLSSVVENGGHDRKELHFGGEVDNSKQPFQLLQDHND